MRESGGCWGPVPRKDFGSNEETLRHDFVKCNVNSVRHTMEDLEALGLDVADQTVHVGTHSEATSIESPSYRQLRELVASTSCTR